MKSKFALKVFKRIAKYSTPEFYIKNLDFMKKFANLFDENKLETIYIHNSNEKFNTVEDYLSSQYYDCFGIREKGTEEEWDVIPVPLLIKILKGEISPRREMNYSLWIAATSDYVATREDFFIYEEDDYSYDYSSVIRLCDNKKYKVYQEFYFNRMDADGWTECISPEVSKLNPEKYGVGGWFSFLTESEDGETIDEILYDWCNDCNFVSYIQEIQRFGINDKEEVIRIFYVDDHNRTCECIYVLEKSFNCSNCDCRVYCDHCEFSCKKCEHCYSCINSTAIQRASCK